MVLSFRRTSGTFYNSSKTAKEDAGGSSLASTRLLVQPVIGPVMLYEQSFELSMGCAFCEPPSDRITENARVLLLSKLSTQFLAVHF
ncbi:MAG: hypothetical protein ACYCPP_00495 [Nitrososphaerales archaeon]